MFIVLLSHVAQYNIALSYVGPYVQKRRCPAGNQIPQSIET